MEPEPLFGKVWDSVRRNKQGRHRVIQELMNAATGESLEKPTWRECVWAAEVMLSLGLAYDECLAAWDLAGKQLPAHVSEAKKSLKESLREAKEKHAAQQESANIDTGISFNATLSQDDQRKVATAVTLMCLRQAVAERAAAVGKDGKGH